VLVLLEEHHHKLLVLLAVAVVAVFLVVAVEDVKPHLVVQVYNLVEMVVQV
jgi:hypothetical protein